jgi:CheY-like chemotaxis protein
MSQLIRPWSLIQQRQIGHGTTMNLFLPPARDVVVKAAEPVPETISRRHGTILVADNEDVVDGAVGVLPKPFTKDNLLASIDVALPQSLTR